MRAFAIIPARGGSKGIPKKNVQTVGGQPLLVRCIAAAQGASAIERTFVSTDDAEIAQVAERAGAAVIRRPSDITDHDAGIPGHAAKSRADFLRERPVRATCAA